MSRLVIMEGWIHHKIKENMQEAYVVLTETHLKIYKSQNSYKSQPDITIKTLDLTESYNILPMSLKDEYQFSIFKKGEKALDRLYLKAASKIDYDCWVNHIEEILCKKLKKSECLIHNVPDPKLSSNTNNVVQNTKSSPRISQPPNNESSELKDLREKYSSLKTEADKSKKENENLIQENKKLKEILKSCEDQLKKINENNNKDKVERENLAKSSSENEKRLTKANEEIRRLKSEKQTITDKNATLAKEVESIKSSNERQNKLEESMLKKVFTDLSKSIVSAGMDFSSYIFCVDRLLEANKSSPVIETLFSQQLTNLIHNCSIDLNTNKNILDYLTINIDLSQDFVILFISRLLTVLSNCINQSTSTNSDPDPNLVSMVKNVVSMTKTPKKIDFRLDFHQTLMEIAYLLSKKITFKNKLSNGISEDVFKKMDNQFENFMKIYKFDPQKIVLLELGQQMKEIFQLKSENKQILKITEVSPKDSNIRHYFNKKWDDMVQKLHQKEREIQDLLITIQEFSSRINSLENDHENQNRFSYDEFINTYTMNAENFCLACQSQATKLLEIPINEKLNAIISDFKLYWTALANVHSMLGAKKQYNSGIREIFDKLTQAMKDFELLMKRFSEITQRNIENPAVNSTTQSSFK